MPLLLVESDEMLASVLAAHPMLAAEQPLGRKLARLPAQLHAAAVHSCVASACDLTNSRDQALSDPWGGATASERTLEVDCTDNAACGVLHSIAQGEPPESGHHSNATHGALPEIDALVLFACDPGSPALEPRDDAAAAGVLRAFAERGRACTPAHRRAVMAPLVRACWRLQGTQLPRVARAGSGWLRGCYSCGCAGVTARFHASAPHAAGCAHRSAPPPCLRPRRRATVPTHAVYRSVLCAADARDNRTDVWQRSPRSPDRADSAPRAAFAGRSR